MLSLFKKISTFYGSNYAPKLYEILKKGYNKSLFKKDCVAGLTIAIISIPLAMALAIASGVSPANGLYTAVVAGFFISLFGGSRYQIGGPTGAFVVVIFNVIQQFGYEGLLVAMIISGVLLTIAGFLKLGDYIKYIPYPVIVGFTAGIAVLLFSTQVKDLLGLRIESVPPEFLPKWRSYIENFSNFTISAILISILSFGTIIGIHWKMPKLPAYLIAVVLSTLIVVVLNIFNINIDTIGSNFGAIPHFLPMPHIPEMHIDLILKVLPSALTIAFLAGVESLLSATVADAMTGENHNSNAELIGEGIANIFAAFFMGIPATGAIARTATNVKAGAYSPMSGIMQAVFLLLFLLLLSPATKYIPLACLSVILIIIAYNMFNFNKFFALLVGQKGDRLTLVVTFLLTVFVDLNAAISVGFILSSVIFMHRISREICATEQLVEYETKGRDISKNLSEHGVISVRLSGPLFFGGAQNIASFFKKMKPPKVLILRMGSVPMVDISGINVVIDFIKKAKKHDTKIIISNIQPQPERVLIKALKKEKLNDGIIYAPNFTKARKEANDLIVELKEIDIPQFSEEPKKTTSKSKNK